MCAIIKTDGVMRSSSEVVWERGREGERERVSVCYLEHEEGTRCTQLSICSLREHQRPDEETFKW